MNNVMCINPIPICKGTEFPALWLIDLFNGRFGLCSSRPWLVACDCYGVTFPTPFPRLKTVEQPLLSHTMNVTNEQSIFCLRDLGFHCGEVN